MPGAPWFAVMKTDTGKLRSRGTAQETDANAQKYDTNTAINIRMYRALINNHDVICIKKGGTLPLLRYHPNILIKLYHVADHDTSMHIYRFARARLVGRGGG